MDPWTAGGGWVMTPGNLKQCSLLDVRGYNVLNVLKSQTSPKLCKLFIYNYLTTTVRRMDKGPGTDYQL